VLSLRRILNWVLSLPSDRLLYIAYRMIRKSRFVYFKAGIPGKAIGGRRE
jgi:hypothetical protein